MFNKLKYYLFKRKHGSYWNYSEFKAINLYPKYLNTYQSMFVVNDRIYIVPKRNIEHLKCIYITKNNNQYILNYKLDNQLYTKIINTLGIGDSFQSCLYRNYNTTTFINEVLRIYQKIEYDKELIPLDELNEHVQIFRDEFILHNYIGSGFVYESYGTYVYSPFESNFDFETHYGFAIPRDKIGHLISLVRFVRSENYTELINHFCENIKMLYPEWNIIVEKKSFEEFEANRDIQEEYKLIVYKSVII